MKDVLGLYTYFKHWLAYDSIWVYSDPHFGDLDCYKRRFPEEFINSTQAEDKLTVACLDEMQIKNINSKCGRKSCLIILGDVGNTDCIKKLRAAYKVLIMGNHDLGKTNYERKIISEDDTCPYCGNKVYQDYNTLYNCGDEYAYCYTCHKTVEYKAAKIDDNKLFDEVVDGKLQITDKITLSHVPDINEHTFNIHGHVHSKYTETNGFNCCAEAINYKPVLLTEIVNCKLSKIVSLTRSATDTAIERKK